MAPAQPPGFLKAIQACRSKGSSCHQYRGGLIILFSKGGELGRVCLLFNILHIFCFPVALSCEESVDSKLSAPQKNTYPSPQKKVQTQAVPDLSHQPRQLAQGCAVDLPACSRRFLPRFGFWVERKSQCPQCSQSIPWPT